MIHASKALSDLLQLVDCGRYQELYNQIFLQDFCDQFLDSFVQAETIVALIVAIYFPLLFLAFYAGYRLWPKPQVSQTIIDYKPLPSKVTQSNQNKVGLSNNFSSHDFSKR